MSDNAGNPAAQVSRTVNVVDTTSPVLVVSVTPEVLEPVNGKLRDVTVQLSAVDTIDPDVTIELVSVVSSEPDDGIGDRATVDDIQGADMGTADTLILLRAERAGNGDGRVYTLTYRAVDDAGNETLVSVDVLVPHDNGVA